MTRVDMIPSFIYQLNTNVHGFSISSFQYTIIFNNLLFPISYFSCTMISARRFSHAEFGSLLSATGLSLPYALAFI